jgi:hypothetical protein
MCNEYMRRSYGNFNAAHQLVHLPDYDDWLYVDRLHHVFQYRPFFVAHFTLDGATTTIDLKDLGNIALHPVVKAIMKEMGNSLFDFGGLLNISVFADELKLGKELLSIDDNLMLSVSSNRKDKVYHLVLSETTNLTQMNADWDYLLIKYRYFFPMTIERNIESLVSKGFFQIGYDDALLSFIARLNAQGKLKALLGTMVALGEDTNEIYSYTQNVTQLADYMALTQSKRTDYTLPVGTDPITQSILTYYQTKASPESRSLLVAFIEMCLKLELITLDEVPNQYLDPNRTIYPYYSGQGGYYGFNTPTRIFNVVFRT